MGEVAKTIGAFAFAGAAVGALWLVFQLPGPDDCGSPTTAYVMSQNSVRDQLRLPSSADFPQITDEAVNVSRSGECTFLVRGAVYAENGFGGTGRLTYLADAEYDQGRGSWSITDVRVQE